MDKSRDNRIVNEMIPNEVRPINLFFCSPGITLGLWVSGWFTVVCLHEGLVGILSRGIIDKQIVGCYVAFDLSQFRSYYSHTFITHVASNVP